MPTAPIKHYPRLLLIILAAEALAACSSSDEATAIDPSPAGQTDRAVTFDTYITGNKSSSRATGAKAATRATAAVDGEITTIEALQKAGFYVFGYYTGSDKWETAKATATPNFMYNQQVTWSSEDKTWSYSPLKFWPNGDGDMVSFFAFAKGDAGSSGSTSGISSTSITSNTSEGSPKISYTAAEDPTQSVDLLWGVVPAASSSASLTAGLPYLDMSKQTVSDKITFLFKHALTKLNVTMYGEFGTTLSATDKTMVLLKDVKITMPVAKGGTLDLCNTTASQPLWTETDYTFDNATDKTSTIKLPLPADLQDIDYGAGTTDEEKEAAKEAWNTRFSNGTGGIRNNKDVSLHDGAYMLVPLDETTMSSVAAGNRQIKIEVTYTAQTVDERLPNGYYRTEETITSTYPLHSFEAGKSYELRIGLGLSAVSIEVKTKDWLEPVVFDSTVSDLGRQTVEITGSDAVLEEVTTTSGDGNN